MTCKHPFFEAITPHVSCPFNLQLCLVAKPLNRSEAKVDLVAFQMQIALLSCQLDTGLYHGKVTFSLTPNQRLGS